MTCPRCQSALPDVAHYCGRCGTDVRAGASGGRSFAVHPGEPVASFNLVSSLMPLAAGSTPQTYRFALSLGLAVPVVAAVLGFLPFAFATAAVVVPVVYLLYLYDVNEWEDQPVPVVLATVGVALLLGAVFTLGWRELIYDDGLARAGRSGIQLEDLLVLCLLVPIVGEILKQIGPLVLASRPKFDDLIDGLTFGVAAGAAFAAAETFILNKDIILDGASRVDNPDSGLWVSLIITAALIKPIVYGAATGIAAASFSGLGEGYDGFKPTYFRGLAEAIVANILFQLGLYLTGQLDGTLGAVLGMLWGFVVAGALILRLRYFLHSALMEGALEAAARGTTPKTAVQDIGFCGSCEMPLLHEAMFCIACGTSVRASSKQTRVANATSSPTPPPDDTVGASSGSGEVQA
jgi:RsiW-degrading membrane proteinase PrsW (M82 family)